MRKSIFLVLYFCFCITLANAKTVSGKVFSDSISLKLSGASIMIKGTLVGVLSGPDGEWTLDIGDKKFVTLIISDVQHKTKEFTIYIGTSRESTGHDVILKTNDTVLHRELENETHEII